MCDFVELHGHGGGRAKFAETSLGSRDELEVAIELTLAGNIAEELVMDGHGTVTDLPPEALVARRYAALEVLSPAIRRLVATPDAPEAEEDDAAARRYAAWVAGPEVEAYLEWQRAVTRRLVAECWPAIEAVAVRLAEAGVLTGAEVAEIFDAELITKHEKGA